MKYQDYVLLGARDVSWKPYSKYEGEFASDPSGCFLSAFIDNRLSAADDLSNRYEEFEELVIKVIDNQIDITSEKLSEEKSLVTKLSKKYEDERDIFVLLTAYSIVLSQGAINNKLSIINATMVERVCSAMENADTDWEKIMTACILWFSDKDNYREQVQKKYSEIKDTPEYKNRPKTSFETYVKVGAKLCYGSDDFGIQFLQFILLHRDELANSIATRIPEFKDVCDLIDETNRLIQNGTEHSEYSDKFAAEFDLLWQKFDENNGLAHDLDFLILASAITSFMGRVNPPEENDGKLIIEMIEQQEDEIYGLVRIELYCSALWFADYKNYQELLINETRKKTVEECEESTDSKALLADHYYQGIGTEKDYEKAFELAMPLAEEGMGLPQKIIGLMYYNGEGIPKNKEEGLYWLKKAASNGLEDAKAFLIQEASKNIDDYDEKLAFLQDFTDRLAEDYETTSSDKSEVEKYIRYFSEVEKYILIRYVDKYEFVTFCTEKCPEVLYKDGYIQPEYYVEMIRQYVDALSEEDPDAAKEHMNLLKDYNFVMIRIQEIAHYYDEGKYTDILMEETNWAHAERLIDDYLREKGLDIPDKDLGVLSKTIGMGIDAFIIYSYSINAVQLFEKVQEKLSNIWFGNNNYQCHLTRTKVMVNGVFSEWSYGLIENDKDGFSAIVFHLMPVRGEVTDAEWNTKCTYMTAFRLFMEQEFCIDQGAIERITIPPHKEAFDDNGFSFVHSDVEEAYNGSRVLLEPYKTTIHNSSANPPSWYKTGYRSLDWSNAKKGSTSSIIGRGGYKTNNSSNGRVSIGKYFMIAGIVILVLIIGSSLLNRNNSYNNYNDDDYSGDEYSEDYNEDGYYVEEYPDNGNDSYYVIGDTYQIQTNLRVREGPGKDYRILTRDELTGDDYANSVDSKTTNDALMEEGKYVTCLGMEGDWMRIESGWICVYDEGEILVR